ncbi:MAG: EAL domain-containing protein [Gammaproteobacteria bacterium]|nr:EAL domain-containing protein [Gammaproteobacteria bacterium]
MTDSKQGRGKTDGNPAAGKLCQRSPTDCHFREYNYILRLSKAERTLLDSYRAVLVAGTSGFAEVFYNYLFDNPAIAEVLYAYERDGGDVGLLARSELQHLLQCLEACNDGVREEQLLEAGRLHVARGFRQSWIIGAYDLLLEYLNTLLPTLDIPGPHAVELDSLLPRILLRDLGVTLEGYWEQTQEETQEELAYIAARLGEAEDMLSGVPHYMWSVDILKNTVIYANFPLQSLYGGKLESPFPGIEDTCVDDRQQLLTAWQNAVSGNTCQVEVRMSLADSETHWYRISLYPSINRQGRTRTVHCLLEDINHQINERIQLQQLATTDRLTGLPNRALWTDHLNMALAASRRAPGSSVVVISLDINQFKMYNDTLGHDVGDVLLRDVAERLNSIVRESDSLSRLGGDQFGILLQPVNNVREATERVITKVLDAFDIPFSHKDKQLCVSLTLGIACFPDDGVSEEILLTNAESAMQRAKRNGLPYQYFDPVNDVSSVQQLHYSGQMRVALENDEFELHYQPQVNLQTSQITGAEALLRWNHPGEGTVMPQRIIPVAEQLGMMTPITDWVLVTSLRQCRQWICNGSCIPVSVNVSARSFQNPRLPDKIKWALDEAGVSGDQLEIEITEATLMQDIDRATEIFARLSDLGVTIAIDDFGTGYSSLSYLKRLPIHTLKIDQSFVMDVAFDHQDIAIVRSIIELGHNLGYKVVAEGVENRMAWDLLVNLGCDTAQGFHISKPLPDERFCTLLAETGRLPG